MNNLSEAVEWALEQEVTTEAGETFLIKNAPFMKEQLLVDYSRQYLNDHDIFYSRFTYQDIAPEGGDGNEMV